MSTATNTHAFSHDTGVKTCNVPGCGKTRGAKVHKGFVAEQAGPSLEQVTADVDMENEMDGIVLTDEEKAQQEQDAVDAAREDMLPDASDDTNDDEIAADLARLEAAEAEKAAAAKKAPAKKAAAKKAPAKKATGEPTATIWVGWRITNAAVLRKDLKVAAKLKAAKPTADLDRTVKLTAEELGELDAVAAKFQEPGHTGPEQYSGRALRGRIAAAIAKIEEASK